jgi:hypothetical protein
MFVLDTNVLSAIMGSKPVPEVAAWIADQPEDLLFTATVCQAEVLSGLAVMPEGRRRLALESAARAISRRISTGAYSPSTRPPPLPMPTSSPPAGAPAGPQRHST